MQRKASYYSVEGRCFRTDGEACEYAARLAARHQGKTIEVEACREVGGKVERWEYCAFSVDGPKEFAAMLERVARGESTVECVMGGTVFPVPSDFWQRN